MVINDNWHVHPGRDCCAPSVTWSGFVPPLPVFPPVPPKCPATTRHQNPLTLMTTGLQCKYMPLHEGDHAAYAGPQEDDVFWPQEVPAEVAP
jgi:hypothetical protein